MLKLNRLLFNRCIIFTAFLIVLFPFISSLDIICSYQMTTWDFVGHHYQCQVSSLTIKTKNEVINNVSGTHLNVMNFDNVRASMIQFATLCRRESKTYSETLNQFKSTDQASKPLLNRISSRSQNLKDFG